MRLKHVWTYVPLPAYARIFRERITFSWITIVYLAFSILHFLVQLGLQTRAFTINSTAFKAGSLLVQQEHVTTEGLPFYANSTLHICGWVPSNLNLNNKFCSIIWPVPSGSQGGVASHPEQDNLPSSIVGYSSYSSSSAAVQTSGAGLSLTAPVDAITPLTTSPLSSISSSTAQVATPPSSTLAGNTQTLVFTTITIASPVTRSTDSVVVSGTQTPQTANTLSPSLPSTSPTTTIATVVVTSQSTLPPATPPVETGINNSGGSGDDGDDGDGGDEAENDGDEDDLNNRGAHPVGSALTLGLGLATREDLTGAATEATEISPVCLKALSYPLSILANTKREDIVFMAFQFWVLGMSVVALLNESIPHIFASLVTHIIATAWGGSQLIHTANFRSDFNTLITHGACEGVDLPITVGYWQARRAAEISSLTLNVLALLVSGLLSWKLFKLFGWQTFKRVGASLTVNRVYKMVLILSITIQLSLFFMAATVSLWLDQLINSVIGDLVDLRKTYLASSIITLVLLIPWLMMGWFGVRRELKIPMLLFLGLCVLYLGGWGVMFVSTTFRWTFVTWRFFSLMAVASVLLTVTCLILGLLCRMNFGKGLPRYLSAQEELPTGDFGFVTPEYEYDDEKVEFPSIEKPMPTFNAAYSNGFPGRGQMLISNGPRFYNQSAPPGAAVVLPPHALNRAPSDGSAHSFSSEKSSSSWDSYYNYSHSRENSVQHGRSKRWVIE
ncbi:hypothetical protein P691DRAFT_770111 [Macrolepiota fuliginosa MF-IS2]|uniref:Uncharacterized protein n=1 Tax=Macrolepiota fuliginosa MF-IS2 TaxID=1400762 RepID=A0A9P6C7D8_9AGAR|nr:hypothetical protein P691DRAFT_770111 [Macrolepiota fuliginosa MF-IS2]